MRTVWTAAFHTGQPLRWDAIPIQGLVETVYGRDGFNGYVTFREMCDWGPVFPTENSAAAYGRDLKAGAA
jgi:hypothetical protein